MADIEQQLGIPAVSLDGEPWSAQCACVDAGAIAIAGVHSAAHAATAEGAPLSTTTTIAVITRVTEIENTTLSLTDPDTPG